MLIEALKTDWTKYYQSVPPTAHLTRRFTEWRIEQTIRQYLSLADYDHACTLRVCELGGANSCFVRNLVTRFNISDYTIIDSNEYGLALCEKSNASLDTKINLVHADILGLDEAFLRNAFDIVFSVGLIEHFTQQGTQDIVAKHYSFAKPQGLVLVTFPTPTLLYRSTRKCLENIGKWSFQDERPLSFDEVTPLITSGGQIMHRSISWPLILTQGVLAAVKNEE